MKLCAVLAGNQVRVLEGSLGADVPPGHVGCRPWAGQAHFCGGLASHALTVGVGLCRGALEFFVGVSRLLEGEGRPFLRPQREALVSRPPQFPLELEPGPCPLLVREHRLDAVFLLSSETDRQKIPPPPWTLT